MPDISDIGDPEELENRYLDKVIVYVEGEPDEKAYWAMLGPDVAHCLELKVPPTTGHEGVTNQVAEERPTNPKIFGLLDGEEAATFGGMEHFIACEDPIFEIPGADGLLFILGHELENILILYGEFCEHISDDVRLNDLGKYSPSDIQLTLREFKQRFFAGALYKYAAKELRRNGSDCKIIDVGRFQAKVTTSSVLKDLRTEFLSEGTDWIAFRSALQSVISKVRSRFNTKDFNADEKTLELIRLADGKQLLNKMRSHFNNTARWEGHLVRNVSRAPFAERFRDLMIEKTGASA